MGDTSRDTQRLAGRRCHMGRGGGIRPVARLSERGHLTRDAACCELWRLVGGGGAGERETLAVVTQRALSRSHVSWRGGGGGGVWLLRMTAKHR